MMVERIKRYVRSFERFELSGGGNSISTRFLYLSAFLYKYNRESALYIR
jgi:hypothetical protein